MLSKKSKNRRSGALGYAEYLREYYEELRRGEAACPSHAELRLFMKQISKSVKQVRCNSNLLDGPVRLRA